MRRMALMVQKKSKDLPSEVLAQKGTNLTRNERQGNKVGHLFLPNLVSILDDEKREVRSKAKQIEMKNRIPYSVFFFTVFSFLEF